LVAMRDAPGASVSPAAARVVSATPGVAEHRARTVVALAEARRRSAKEHALGLGNATSGLRRAGHVRCCSVWATVLKGRRRRLHVDHGGLPVCRSRLATIANCDGFHRLRVFARQFLDPAHTKRAGEVKICERRAPSGDFLAGK
jgi:hypothetical protein